MTPFNFDDRTIFIEQKEDGINLSFTLFNWVRQDENSFIDHILELDNPYEAWIAITINFKIKNIVDHLIEGFELFDYDGHFDIENKPFVDQMIKEFETQIERLKAIKLIE
jgi:hypothetical protein